MDHLLSWSLLILSASSVRGASVDYMSTDDDEVAGLIMWEGLVEGMEKCLQCSSYVIPRGMDCFLDTEENFQE